MSETKNWKQQWSDRTGALERIGTSGRAVVELGCGANPRVKGAISVDRVNIPGVDIIADINDGLGFFPDNSIDEIYSFHFLEHVNDLQLVMSELHRVLKPGGKVGGTVPHFSNPYFYSDYTHRAPFGLYTFSYFCDNPYFKREVPTFYNTAKFKLKHVRLVFASPFRHRNTMKKAWEHLFNLNRSILEFYEENLCYFIPAFEIAFEIEKKED